jgi:hypothetical protein
MLCQIVTKALVVSGFSLFQQEGVYTFGFQNKVQGHATNQIRTPSTSKYIHWFFCYNFDHSLLFEKTVHTDGCLLAVGVWCVGCNYTKILSFFFPVVLNLAYVLLKFETITYGCRMSNCQGLQSPATTYILVDAQTSSNKKKWCMMVIYQG